MTKDDSTLVDMVALARENALADAMLTKPGMRKVIAPAKVNLYLGIGERMDAGFHAVENVLHAVMLHDIVYVRAVPGDAGQGLRIAVVCAGKGDVAAPQIAPEDNIAYRATQLLAERLGRNADETVEIAIEKHVPHQAGLGGGSSDAAAVLVGLADAWGIDEGDPALVSVAHELGSDVAFFLQGGCALFDGRGESFVRSLAPRRESIVIVKPDAGLSTAAVYAEHDAHPVSVDAADRERMSAAQSASEVPFVNNLAFAAERLMPELETVRTWLEGQDGVESALLCGSGSSTFALCTDFSTASAVAAKAQANGWWARATSLSSVRASVIPR